MKISRAGLIQITLTFVFVEVMLFLVLRCCEENGHWIMMWIAIPLSFLFLSLEVLAAPRSKA